MGNNASKITFKVKNALLTKARCYCDTDFPYTI